MTTRRDVIKTVAAASVATAILGVKNAMAANANLTWKHFPAGEHGFFRAPVLISGAHEAVLIDAGCTLPDGKALVKAITGNVEKKLATWGPQLKENGPQTLADIVMPEAFDGRALTLEGQTVEIVN